MKPFLRSCTYKRKKKGIWAGCSETVPVQRKPGFWLWGPQGLISCWFCLWNWHWELKKLVSRKCGDGHESESLIIFSSRFFSLISPTSRFKCWLNQPMAVQELREKIRDKVDEAGTIPIPDWSLWIPPSPFSGGGGGETLLSVSLLGSRSLA